MNLNKAIIAMGHNGKFSALLETLDIKEECLTSCNKSNYAISSTPDDTLHCFIPGKCIAATLNNYLIMDMLYKAEVITEQQLEIFYGP